MVGQREIRLGERVAPPALAVRSVAGGVLLRVVRNPPCLAMVQDEIAVNERVIREARLGPIITGGALIASGGWLFFSGDSERADGRRASGLLLGVAGFIVAMTQGSDSEESYRTTRLLPPRERASECRTVDEEVRSVALLLPDRSMLQAERTGTGLWRADVPDETWERWGNHVSVWVIVDGANTHRVQILRP